LLGENSPIIGSEHFGQRLEVSCSAIENLVLERHQFPQKRFVHASGFKLLEFRIVDFEACRTWDSPPEQAARRLKGLPLCKRILNPLLANDALLFPFALVQDELAEFGEVLGCELQTRHAMRIAGLVLRPGIFRDAHWSK